MTLRGRVPGRDSATIRDWGATRHHKVEATVVAEFGDARELALAYSPEGSPMLRNRAGEVVLSVSRYVAKHGPAAARAVGRGTTKVLKWTAISLAVLLVVSLGVGAWAYYEVKPYIPAIIEQSEPAFSYAEVCRETPCNGEFPAGAFFVSEDARSVRMSFDAYPVKAPAAAGRVGNGTLVVRVLDPAGAAVFDRSSNLTGWLHYETTWASVPGTWRVVASYTDFVGGLDMEARAIVLPWGEER